MIDRIGTANVVTAGKDEEIVYDLPITPATVGLTKFTYETVGMNERKLVTVRVTVGTDTLAAVVDYELLAAALTGLDSRTDQD